MCLHDKLHTSKQRQEKNATAYILRFLSNAKLAYPTAMDEEVKVVSFLKGFTDRALAGHLFGTGRVNTLGTAIEVALEKEAQQKKNTKWWMRSPWRWVRRRKNRSRQIGFRRSWKPCRGTWGNYRPSRTSRSPAQPKTSRWVYTLEQTWEHRQYCGLRTHICKGRWTRTTTTAPTKNRCDVVYSRPANLRMLQRDRPLRECLAVSSQTTYGFKWPLMPALSPCRI